jgi:hypothetical protein
MIRRSVFEPCAALCELPRKKGLEKGLVVLLRQHSREDTVKLSFPSPVADTEPVGVRLRNWLDL